MSLSTLLQVQAQDLHFSQFYAAPLDLSPSLARRAPSVAPASEGLRYRGAA